ncbi:MAG TPA: glycosyltransferase family 4 protein [Pirellulales bacterium]|jgi:glycosyltransferase involved in cell wall biosynthesis|nr:glycosyltransferase family 4 protein [Pirellulales bacterium]
MSSLVEQLPATPQGSRAAGSRPRIVYLAAGAAGMYCGSCLHDNTLAAALLEQGTDILLMPTYTPIRTDETDVSQQRVLFGGINVYLQQLVPLARYIPQAFDRWLDSPLLLNMLSRLPLSVDARKLGKLTVSTLRGEQGNQRKEVENLVRWLEREARPDLVHLSNAMLTGFAREIARRLRVPVVCSLSGEDIFLEKVPEPYYSQAREILRERAADVTQFVALNAYYADFMADYLAVPRSRIEVITHGLKLDGHAPRSRPTPGEPTIGFLGRICADKGLHNLVDALRLLAADNELPRVRIAAAGYLGAADRRYLRDLQGQLKRWNLAERFEYHGELDRDEKIAFLQSLDMLSLPTEYRESKGLAVFEAWANAVPVVLPAHGTFPELVNDTQGGLLFVPGDTTDLAAKLKHLVLNPHEADELGRRGHASVHDRYHDRAMATRTAQLYQRLLLPVGALAPAVSTSAHQPQT